MANIDVGGDHDHHNPPPPLGSAAVATTTDSESFRTRAAILRRARQAFNGNPLVHDYTEDNPSQRLKSREFPRKFVQR